MSLLEILLRGSAWLALAISILGLLVIAYDVALSPEGHSRRERRVGSAIGIVFILALWLGLACAAGGGTVNP